MIPSMLPRSALQPRARDTSDVNAFHILLLTFHIERQKVRHTTKLPE
jgi:hypothetical protein